MKRNTKAAIYSNQILDANTGLPASLGGGGGGGGVTVVNALPDSPKENQVVIVNDTIPYMAVYLNHKWHKTAFSSLNDEIFVNVETMMLEGFTHNGVGTYQLIDRTYEVFDRALALTCKDNEIAALTFRVDVPIACTLYIYVGWQTESVTHDAMLVYINGTMVHQKGGQVLENAMLPLAANTGVNEIKIEYKKDGSVGTGEDRCWVFGIKKLAQLPTNTN